MTTDQLPWMQRSDVAGELATARHELAGALAAIQHFPEFSSTRPWVYLEELLADLRGAAVTVRALEDLLRAYPE